MPGGLVIVLWLLVALRIREAFRRPPGRRRMAAIFEAGAVLALLAVPIVAVAAARIDTATWVDEGNFAGAANSTQPVSACRVSYLDANLRVGPIQIGTQRIHYALCWDGKTVTRLWGPDCTGPGSLLVGGEARTCQVVDSGTASARPQANFYVSPFSLPFWKREAFVQSTVGADGTSRGIQGAFGVPHGTLLDVHTEGTRTTSRFVADRAWQLAYGFDCSAVSDGTFQMELVADENLSNGSAGFSASGGVPGEVTRRDQVTIAAPGVYHLKITSTCLWQVTVRD